MQIDNEFPSPQCNEAAYFQQPNVDKTRAIHFQLESGFTFEDRSNKRPGLSLHSPTIEVSRQSITFKDANEDHGSRRSKVKVSRSGEEKDWLSQDRGGNAAPVEWKLALHALILT